MTKGILMSKDGRHGVILTKDGGFETVYLPKNKKSIIGEEIQIQDFKRNFRIPKPVLSALAACLILVVVFGAFGLGGQNKAVAAYVSFDSNPSFEAGVDKNLHVLEIHPMNKDGSKVLTKIKNYKNLSLSDFTNKVAGVLEKEGYFADHPNMVVSMTITDKMTAKAQKPLEAKIDKAVSQIGKRPGFARHHGKLQVIQTSMNLRKKASKLGFTAGKYTLYVNATKQSPSITAEKAKQMTIDDLLKSKKQPKKTDSTLKTSANTESNSKASLKNVSGKSQIQNKGQQKKGKNVHPPESPEQQLKDPLDSNAHVKWKTSGNKMQPPWWQEKKTSNTIKDPQEKGRSKGIKHHLNKNDRIEQNQSDSNRNKNHTNYKNNQRNKGNGTHDHLGGKLDQGLKSRLDDLIHKSND